jgi:CO/xanthine dehydrogenase FAD-binding subunit/carbon monoxide dehydrogenase subunit G
MASHADIASSALVKKFAPGLCALANGIADQQVRNMGTIGGSLANNDPAACWPAAVLACGAVIHTQHGSLQRSIPAADFFQGVYTTALQPGELITTVEFPSLAEFEYIKFEQQASRFALVGVALAQHLPFRKATVAITGLGSGVVVWQEAGQALSSRFNVAALDDLRFPHSDALADLHASALYRAHLVSVLTRRCVARISKENPALPGIERAQSAIKSIVNESVPTLSEKKGGMQIQGGMPMQGEQVLRGSLEDVWCKLLDPEILSQCIVGCELFEQTTPNHYTTTVKVGLGPVSARFKVQLALSDLQPPQSCRMQFSGSAGALGSGEGEARVHLTSLPDGQTHLQWQAQTQVTGKLAQFGSRLIHASANKLSEDFFKKFALQLAQGKEGQTSKLEPQRGIWHALKSFFQRISGAS